MKHTECQGGSGMRDTIRGRQERHQNEKELEQWRKKGNSKGLSQWNNQSGRKQGVREKGRKMGGWVEKWVEKGQWGRSLNIKGDEKDPVERCQAQNEKKGF